MRNHLRDAPCRDAASPFCLASRTLVSHKKGMTQIGTSVLHSRSLWWDSGCRVRCARRIYRSDGSASHRRWGSYLFNRLADAIAQGKQEICPVNNSGARMAAKHPFGTEILSGIGLRSVPAEIPDDVALPPGVYLVSVLGHVDFPMGTCHAVDWSHKLPHRVSSFRLVSWGSRAPVLLCMRLHKVGGQLN